MLDAGRRPMGRLFYWALVGVSISLFCALKARGQNPPATTTVQEVRMHDFGWGPANDRNLLGRFSTRSFTLPRLARTQNYFLRLYDNSSQPRYSRYAVALHVDYPL